jgi:hypothetical protein
VKLYKIRNWDEFYENNRSRTVKELSWVAIPNRHDGENFSNIMTHEHGAEIFASFILLVQVASRCQPRGSLLRGHKKPHNSASLSVKTRAPKKWFDIGLDYLEKNTDWLEVVQLADGCQDTVSVLSGDCQHGDEEGKGKKEGNGSEGTLYSVVSDFERRVGQLFRRNGSRWPHAEERLAYEICERETLIEEMILVEKYHADSLDEKPCYFPKSVRSLLEKWTQVVDQARTFKPTPKKLDYAP